MGFFSPGAMLYLRLNSFEMKMEHNQVILYLQKCLMEISDALNKCQRLREENKSVNKVPDLAYEGLILPSLSLAQSENFGSSLTAS